MVCRMQGDEYRFSCFHLVWAGKPALEAESYEAFTVAFSI
jgi:hypothetical protein